MIRRPPRSTLFPSRRSSDLGAAGDRLATTPVSEEPLQPPTMQWRLSNLDRKSTRLNSSHGYISYAVFCLKKKKDETIVTTTNLALKPACRTATYSTLAAMSY